MNHPTPDSVLDLMKFFSQNHLSSSSFLLSENDLDASALGNADANKLREFLFPKHQNFSSVRSEAPDATTELDQRFSLYSHLWRDLRQADYPDKKGLTSPPLVFDPEGSDRRAGFSTYSGAQRKMVRPFNKFMVLSKAEAQAHHIINYKKASVIGGLNLVAITLGFHQAMNTWGKTKGKFHLKDDWKGDGLAQTDELSHFMWGYKMTQFFYRTYDWTGFSPKASQILSSSESALILTLVEYPIDAYNPKQGLGVSDLIFDYLGVGMAIAKKYQSWLNDFDFKISWKKNIFSQNKTPFAQTYEEYDNFIYWLTCCPKLFLLRKLLCFGFGYSVTHLGFEPRRELYGGIGLSIPDFISLFGRKLGDKSKFLEILYPNIHIKL
jgi:hypothetical protein